MIRTLVLDTILLSIREWFYAQKNYIKIIFCSNIGNLFEIQASNNWDLNQKKERI